jgi:hypothetical protein
VNTIKEQEETATIGGDIDNSMTRIVIVFETQKAKKPNTASETSHFGQAYLFVVGNSQYYSSVYPSVHWMAAASELPFSFLINSHR